MGDVRLRTGITLHTERGGAPSGPVVLFANGLTMDTTAWDGVIAALEPSLATVRFDARGQGSSEKPEGPFTPEQHAADLVALLDALALPPVHLVGLSNGGLVAMLAATLEPDRVRSLTVIDSFPRVDPFLRFVLRSWRAALKLGGSEMRFDVATPWIWGQAYLEAHEEELFAYRAKAAAADPGPVLGLIGGLLGFTGDARDDLRHYGGPVAAVVGEDDVLTPLRYAREILQAAGGGRLEVVPGAGHAAPLERPEHVARVIGEIVAQAEGAEG